MDDENIKQVFEKHQIPPVDDNRRKEILNLAVAEFEKKEKIRQGNGFLSRLIFRQSNKERELMSFSQKKTIYGGLATACVALMIFTSYPLVMEKQQAADKPIAKLNKIKFETNGAGSAPAPDFAAGATLAESTAPAVAQRAENDHLTRWRSMQQARIVPAPSMPQQVTADLMLVQPVVTGRDKFKDFEQNGLAKASENPVSTFSIDVDTSSYSFVRQSLENGVLPQSNAVRIEEMINYFDYAYPSPTDRSEPFKASVVVKNSPWNEGRKLIAIGLKGYEAPKAAAPDSNLVFLVDTSGSMAEQNKLPLLKQSLTMLLDQLKSTDKVSIVAYAGSAGTILPPTPASEKQKIIMALQNLQSGGSTAGGEGINLAYDLAQSSFVKGAVNRVILATDGDFNVGISNPEELKSFIERKRESGIFLSVLGFGQGNYNDALMQELAQNGNGVAAYIDNLNEARKVLVEEAGAMLFPIAKDVKIQVEFNPASVSEYRLVGYETRALAREDFSNDKVDAGDIGSGHEVTALYEITPVGTSGALDKSRYANSPEQQVDPDAEYGFLKLRYKLPEDSKSNLITLPITRSMEQAETELARESDFAVAVAGFAQLLKGGKHTGNLDYDKIIQTAESSKGPDPFGYRREFINMVYKTKTAAAMAPASGSHPGTPLPIHPMPF